MAAAASAASAIRELRAHRSYSSNYALSQLRIARGSGSWDERLFAALALEHQLLLLDPREVAEQAKFAEALGCDERLRLRIERRAYVHQAIASARSDAEALRAARPLLRAPCRIAVARYLFTAEEIFARVLEEVDATPGIADRTPRHHASAADEGERAVDALPDVEAALVRLLAAGSRTYWTSPRVPSHLHALVEHPAGTVALTIKPPGSEQEIELKRAGVRGPRPLDIVSHRAGELVPASHHLWGGSQCDLLRWEASESSLLSRIYRVVHGEEAAMSRTVSITSVYQLPDGQHVLESFARPELRDATCTALEQLKCDPSPAPPLELAGRFLARVHPAQAIEIGTTSFRLDRVLRWLTADGARSFFRSIGERWTPRAARDFADEVLEEVIPDYRPPSEGGLIARPPAHDRGLATVDYDAYVAAALRANAASVRATYDDALRQLGTMFGTLAGVRGASSGESFTPRNVGLRCVLEEGTWRVRLICMDHDSVNINGVNEEDFHPRPRSKAMAYDIKHVLFSVRTLGAIYRRSGMKPFREAAFAAYRRTLRAFRTNDELRVLFRESYVRRVHDWDVVVRRYLATPTPEWRVWVRRYLCRKDYPAGLIEEYLIMVPTFGRFWRDARFLYGG